MQMQMAKLQEKGKLLSLMYKHSRNPDNLIVPVRVLRSNVMMKLKLQRPGGYLYPKSPLYRGAVEWDKLPPDKQEILTHVYVRDKKDSIEQRTENVVHVHPNDSCHMIV